MGLGPIFGIDYHHRLSVAETASFSQRMPPGTLDFLEEPIRDESPEAYAALRSMVDIPFAIGEEISSKWGFLPYIERGLTNYAAHRYLQHWRLHRGDEGGRLGRSALHRPDAAQPAGADLHGCHGATRRGGAQLRLAGNALLSTGDTYNFDDDLFPIAPRLQGTHFPVLDTPGLGVDFNEELALKQPFKFWEAPHLHKRDGSYTNW